MAQKRMFDRAIIDTDRFMDLSMSSKALYFLLGMEADDEGFVSYKKVMRIHGGNEDDVKVLLAKNFIIGFESGVVVITDWNSNNYLQSNRIKPTEYQKEKNMLVLTDANKYVFNNGLTSIEESSIEEKRIPLRASSPVAPVKEKKTPKPIVWTDYIQLMDNSKSEHITLIAHYFKERGIKFDTDFEVQEAISRHSRYATKVIKFGKEKVFSAIEECKRMEKQKGIQWTLETVYKQLTK